MAGMAFSGPLKFLSVRIKENGIPRTLLMNTLKKAGFYIH